MDGTEELRLKLHQGRKECIHINGLIRKLRSLKAILKYRKDKTASQKLDEYVEKMYDSLKCFKSAMKSALEEAYVEKVDALGQLQKEYELDIENISRLCEDAEKLVKVDKTVTWRPDLREVNRFVEKFSSLVSDISRGDLVDQIAILDFQPAITDESIINDLFGKVVTAPSAEVADSPMLDNVNNNCVDIRSTCEQSTQTDIPEESTNCLYSPSHPTGTPVVTQPSNAPAQFTYMNKNNYARQPLVSYQVSPAYDYLVNSFSCYEAYSPRQSMSQSPPPGFLQQQAMQQAVPTGLHVYSQPASGMVTDMAPCMLANMSMYPQPRPNYTSQQYNTMAAPLSGYASQIGQVYPSRPSSQNKDDHYAGPVNNRPGSCTQQTSEIILNRKTLPQQLTNQQNKNTVPNVPTKSKQHVNGESSNRASSRNSKIVREDDADVAYSVEDIPLPCDPINNENVRGSAMCQPSHLSRISEGEEEVDEVTPEKLCHGNGESEKKAGYCSDYMTRNVHNDTKDVRLPGFCEIFSKINISDSESRVNSTTKDIRKGNEGCKDDKCIENEKCDSAIEDKISELKERIQAGFGNLKEQQYKLKARSPVEVVEDSVEECFNVSRNDEVVDRPGKSPESKTGSQIPEYGVRKVTAAPDKRDHCEVNEIKDNVQPVPEINTVNLSAVKQIQAKFNLEGKTFKPLRRPLAVPTISSEDKIGNIIKGKEKQTECATMLPKGSEVKKPETIVEYRTGTKGIKTSVDDSWKKNNLNVRREENVPVSRFGIKRLRSNSSEDWDEECKVDTVTGSGNSRQSDDNNSKQNLLPPSKPKQLDVVKKEVGISSGFGSPNRPASAAASFDKEKPMFVTRATTRRTSVPEVSEWWDDSGDTAAPTDANNNQHKTDKYLAGNHVENDTVGTTKMPEDPNKVVVKVEIEDTTVIKEETDQDFCSPRSARERNVGASTKVRTIGSIVKGHLGRQLRTDQQRPSTSQLGSLQTYWLSKPPGIGSVPGKLLFKCSHDLHFPIGVSSTSMEDIIIADTGNHCMKTFTTDGKYHRTFGDNLVPSMRRPSAIVVNEEDEIFVKDDICIRVFDKSGSFLRNIAEDTFTKPFGLVMGPGPHKRLIVLETNYRKPSLIHISQDGKTTWRYPYAPLINAVAGSKCRFMGISQSTVIVSDLGLSRVYITSLEGEPIRWFGNYGTGPMDFNEPSGISVDTYGNIVIGDSKNNRIQIYRHDGSYTGHVELDEKIVRPSGIHLTGQDRLLVVNFLHHVVKVYQL